MMAVILSIFLVLGIVTPILTRVLHRRVFYVLALIPAATFAWTLAQGHEIAEHGAVTEVIEWVPQLSLALSFRMDSLAWILALVVTGVGALVLLYCARYFKDTEPSLGRFAALLFAFAGTMFGLVTADDIILMFMFWEITSVLSYLLIGHYTGKKESRGAALQALLVTTFGGLIMLVGVVMLATGAGSTSMHDIVAASLEGPAATVAVILLLIGAMSKSAMVPFHFWLPAAMAAPTPVSAYLHAAAMVKAGVYLVARFAPGYAETPGWHVIVIGFGVWTMIVGAWRSLRQYDLKLILAYGTVSQLGFLIIVVGYGTPDSALAGVALLLAHAVYKSTLFLVVGIIDHSAGTRDWRQLTGVGKRAPALAVIAIIAGASMAGIPPTFGFVAKEGVFGAFIDSAAAGEPWAIVALVGTAIGSMLTVAYTVRFLWGAFGTRRVTAKVRWHAPGAGILVAPGVLSAASIVLGLAAGPLGHWLEPYATSLPGDLHAHLALWHGFEPALGLSAIVVAVGALLFWRRAWIATAQDRVPAWFDASRGYWWTTQFIDRISARVTIFGQRGGLPQYLSTILVVFVLTLGSAALVSRAWPETVRWFDYPAQLVIAAIMAIATVAAAASKRRMGAVLLVGVTGYGMVALFAFHGAPDLAVTQALVETITIIAFVLVLRRLPSASTKQVKRVHRVRRGLIGAGVGIVMGAIAVISLAARQHPSISEEWPRLAFEEGHGRNIVNVVLVDIRAWDTMGEISVLVVFATGIASLLFVSGRAGIIPRLAAAQRKRSRATRRIVIADPDVPNTHREARQSWLVAGGSIASENRSILLEVLVRLIFHPAIVVSIFLLFVGHNSPGGGFAGGLLAGLALVFRYLAGGRYELGEAVPIDAGKLLGAGLLLAVGTAIGSLFFGADILTSAYLSADIPVLGHISIGTSTIFDIGVYLVVVGLVLDILRSLGAEVDRQQANANVSGESTDEFSPQTSPITTAESRTTYAWERNGFDPERENASEKRRWQR